MTINDISKTQCYGCMACKNICPKKCIENKRDENGFWYPYIIEEECVDCGLCYRTCPLNHKEEIAVQKVYAVKANEDIRKESASGGMFTILSDYVLEQNGVIFGAAFDEEWNLKHIKAVNQKERDRCRGSKYLQSNLGDTYKEIICALKEGKKVLFTGTPCQVAGVKSVIKHEDLILVDIICHGVASPKVFEGFVKYIEKTLGNKIKKISFRDKEYGWSNQLWSVEDDKGNKYKEAELKRYKRVYYEHLAHRESCFNCQYASLERSGDITMGDYWGVNDSIPEFNDEKGISLVWANTKKGQEILDSVLKQEQVIERNIQDCLQPQLQEPVKYNKNRERFLKLYHKKGFKKSTDIVFEYTILKKVKNKMKNMLLKN